MVRVTLRCHMWYLRMEVWIQIRGHPSNHSLNNEWGGEIEAATAKEERSVDAEGRE